MRKVILGDYQATACLLIEAMNDTRAFLPADA